MENTYFILIRFQKRYHQACQVYNVHVRCVTIYHTKLEKPCVLYQALIVPYFVYSSCVWGYIGKGLSEKLQLLQNRAARIVTLSNCETLSKDLLDELGWEVLEDRKMRQLTNSNVQNKS